MIVTDELIAKVARGYKLGIVRHLEMYLKRKDGQTYASIGKEYNLSKQAVHEACQKIKEILE